MSSSNSNSGKWTAKRVAACIGIAALLGMYVITFISAIGGFPDADKLFRASLGLTIGLPILLWIIIWCLGRFTNRETIADLNILNSNPEERARMEDAIRKEMETKADPTDHISQE